MKNIERKIPAKNNTERVVKSPVPVSDKDHESIFLRALREEYLRENRIIDSIPGLNTAPQLRDTRNAEDVQIRSRERIDNAENADKNFKAREHRIKMAIANSSEVQRILAKKITTPREEIKKAPGNPAIATFLKNRVIEQKKEIKAEKNRDNVLIHDTAPITEFLMKLHRDEKFELPRIYCGA